MKSVIMRSTYPICINNMLPNLSIKKIANSVNMKLVVPMPTEEKSAADLPSPTI